MIPPSKTDFLLGNREADSGTRMGILLDLDLLDVIHIHPLVTFSAAVNSAVGPRFLASDLWLRRHHYVDAFCEMRNASA
jgi:hypothetical protein